MNKQIIWIVGLLLGGMLAAAGCTASRPFPGIFDASSPGPGGREDLRPTAAPGTDPAVTGPPTSAAVTPSAASIEVRPLEAAVGEELTITGSGFPPQETVQLGIGRVNSEFDVLKQVTTDSQGAFQAGLTVPEFVDPADNHFRITVISEQVDILDE